MEDRIRILENRVHELLNRVIKSEARVAELERAERTPHMPHYDPHMPIGPGPDPMAPYGIRQEPHSLLTPELTEEMRKAFQDLIDKLPKEDDDEILHMDAGS